MRRLLALVLFGITLPGPLLAQEQDQQQPIVRVTLSPESVSVGEAADMRVTVLVPTWFASPPVFPTFEIANAITRLPPDSSFPTSERVGGETWSGIVRDYRLYPLLAATFRIGNQAVHIRYANPGGQPLSAQITIPDIVLRATVPPGAENLQPFIAGRELRLSQEISGDTSSLQIGDALVVLYTAELDGMPAMFLPPLAPSLDLEGVSVYADTPVLDDGTPSRRSEKLTLVFKSGGEFTVPGIALDWWNTTSGEVDTSSVAAMVLSVNGPIASTNEATKRSATNWLFVLASVAAVLAAALLARRTVPALTNRLRTATQAHRQSEKYAFNELREALREGRPRAVYHAMLHWLERLETGMDARRFATVYGTGELVAAVDQMVVATYSDPDLTPNLKDLRAELTAARSNWRKTRVGEARFALPNLNP
jgi:hypothetical protein